MVYMQYSHELEIKFPTWMGLELWLIESRDSELTILSVRVQVSSNLEIWFNFYLKNKLKNIRNCIPTVADRVNR